MNAKSILALVALAAQVGCEQSQNTSRFSETPSISSSSGVNSSVSTSGPATSGPATSGPAVGDASSNLDTPPEQHSGTNLSSTFETLESAEPLPSLVATSSSTHLGADATASAPTTNSQASEDLTSTFEGEELFILFGQSNMSGFTPMLDEPWALDENVMFMVQYDCPRLNQTKDAWLVAQPPLHGCQWATNGLGLGLGDYFGKAMASAWPTSKIGLIPNAIPAVTIDIFMKGGPSPGGGTKALPDGYTSAYTLMVDRAKEAQKRGRIRAILLNQGESDFNQGFGDEWPSKVATVVADLRADLGLSDAVPFIAGEVPPTGNYSGHNVNVHKLPDHVPNCAVVTGEGTGVHDGIHFDQASVQLMGERYAAAVMRLLDEQ